MANHKTCKLTSLTIGDRFLMVVIYSHKCSGQPQGTHFFQGHSSLFDVPFAETLSFPLSNIYLAAAVMVDSTAFSASVRLSRACRSVTQSSATCFSVAVDSFAQEKKVAALPITRMGHAHLAMRHRRPSRYLLGHQIYNDKELPFVRNRSGH